MEAFEIRAMNLMVKMATKYTPDYPVLQERGEHLFFIIDDFQRGCPNHHHLGASEFGCRAFSMDGFECYRETLIDKVVPFYERRKPDVFEKKDFARIKGEVYVVSTNQIPKLDTAMRNTVQFVRRRIKLLAPWHDHVCVDNGKYDTSGIPLSYHIAGFKHWLGPEMVYLLEAWVYIAIRDYWNPLIDGLSFDRLEMHDDERYWLRRYYQFNKRRNE